MNRLIHALYWLFLIVIAYWAYNDSKLMHTAKCDRRCLGLHQYSKVQFRIGIPAWECHCSGYGRMPDDYLNKK